MRRRPGRGRASRRTRRRRCGTGRSRCNCGATRVPPGLLQARARSLRLAQSNPQDRKELRGLIGVPPPSLSFPLRIPYRTNECARPEERLQLIGVHALVRAQRRRRSLCSCGARGRARIPRRPPRARTRARAAQRGTGREQARAAGVSCTRGARRGRGWRPSARGARALRCTLRAALCSLHFVRWGSCAARYTTPTRWYPRQPSSRASVALRPARAHAPRGSAPAVAAPRREAGCLATRGSARSRAGVHARRRGEDVSA